MGKINSVHDNFIRAIMADKSIAAAYFQNFLPSFVSEKLDFDTLTQLSDTYVSGSLHKTISDIVYSCRIKETDDGVKVCLLIEHKSAPDRSTPIQMGSYIFSGMQKQVDNKEELSLIIPILLYHGKNKWRYETVNGLFKNLDPDWKIFLPDFDYVYNNLGELSQRKVEALNNKFCQLHYWL
jgi:predicted transposase/invertase (TIGR01784 family)